MKEQWIYEQFSTIDVGDARLQKRAVDVAIGCAEHPEKSLAGRFDIWADLQVKQASRILALFGMIGVIATKLLAMREQCRLFPETPVEKKCLSLGLRS